jgi:DNA-binding SARP family transcriptional activator
MSTLRACLFQTLQIRTPEGIPLDLGSPTNRSLLAYLLLHRASLVDRRRLAFVFWPEVTESAARRNLRQYLHRIRSILEPVYPAGRLILADESGIQFNPEIQIWIDVEEFCARSRPGAGLEDLRAAVDLYRGDLLEDLYEDWCLEKRRELHEIFIDLLDQLTQGLQAQKNFEEAIRYAQKWADSEPLDESAHRRLLSLLALNGDRNRAILHYRKLKETLARELEAEPLPATEALFQNIQNGSPIINPAPRLKSPPVRPVFAKPPPLPLVGRRSELAVLESAQRRASEGYGQFILITGESGIGKTRLIQELLTRSPDLPTLYGICHELELVAPYAPLRGVFAKALDLLPDLVFAAPQPWMFTLVHLLPSLLKRLPYLALREVSAGGSLSIPEAYTGLLLSLIDNVSKHPVNLIFDDLHWGDGPTWDFLSLLSRYAEAQPLLVIGLCRLEDLPRERVRLIRTLERNGLLRQVALSRLSPEETAELSAHLLTEAPLDQLFLTRLYKETEGNPFFIIETLRAMQESGHPPSLTVNYGGRIPAFSLPLSVQRVIEARIDRLSPESQALLATAAAVGRAFTFSILVEIGPMPAAEVIAHIEEWLQRGLVREAANAYDFSHDKIRHVAYSTLSRARRQYIHRLIAGVLEITVPPADPVTLAYHFARSDQPLKALPHLTRAGEQALQVRSYQEARQFGLRAVSLLGRMPGPRLRSERIELNLQLAQAYAYSGDLTHALEILSETEYLAANLEEHVHLGRIFHRLSQIFWLRGQPEVAGDYARRALRLAEDQKDPVLLQGALRMLGRTGIALAAFDDAIAYLQRYLRLKEQFPRPPDLPIIYGYLGIAYARVGSWSRAFEAAQLGLSLAESEGSTQTTSFARMQLGFIHAEFLNWQECLNVLELLPDPLELDSDRSGAPDPAGKDPRLGLTPFGFMLLGLRGRALAHTGRPELAIDLIQPALNWAEQGDYKVFHYLPRIFLTEALDAAHKRPLALNEGQRALDEARAAGNRWATGVTLRILADHLSRYSAPHWSRVEDYLIESMFTLRQVRARPDLARTYLSLRRLYDRAGQIAWAVDCHFRATAIFEELGMHAELRRAQGQAAGERRGAVVIPDMRLRGPNAASPE